MKQPFEGRRVVITGAARGVGRALTAAFVDGGAHVVAVDVSEQGLRDLTGQVDVTPVLADIATSEGADDVIDAAGERLDVLVNNAAILDRLALVDETEESDWDRVLAVNLTAPFLLCRRALPLMVSQGGGVIVNISSIAGLTGGRAGAAYTASKHGLIGLTKNIAATFAQQGIRCVAICPGGMGTGMDLGGTPSERGLNLTTRDRDRPSAGTADEIAAIATFLASGAASRINGAVIVADGGSLAF